MLQEARNAETPGAPWDARLSFGDAYPDYPAHFIALSSGGLSLLGFPDTPHDGRATLPHAFASGMAARARVLGDAGTPADPARWRWSDGAAHALLLSYARDPSEQAATDDTLTVMFEQYGIAVDSIVRADLQRRGLADSDGFGTRDGISQPIMRHTQAFAKGKAAPDDVVGAGSSSWGIPIPGATCRWRSPCPPIRRRRRGCRRSSGRSRIWCRALGGCIWGTSVILAAAGAFWRCGRSCTMTRL